MEEKKATTKSIVFKMDDWNVVVDLLRQTLPQDVFEQLVYRHLLDYVVEEREWKE